MEAEPPEPREFERIVTSRLEELAAITDEPPGLTRTFLSPAHARARALVAGWMRGIGLTVYEDAAANLIGRWECPDPAAATLVCGSHLDTVRNAGRYDGAAGIVVGLLAVERARARAPRHHLEVVAFSDEEGVRFHTTYLGSRAYVDRLGPVERAAVDRDGVNLAAALAGHRPVHPPPPARLFRAYVEAHIEQGPVLEQTGRALGVVTAIAGQTRARVTLTGRAGHAGTTPMSGRRDALAGAAEAVGLVESLARAEAGLVATVGQLEVPSAASNVIPGLVWFTVDIRSPDDAIRVRFGEELFARLDAAACTRGLSIAVETVMTAPAVPCDPALTEVLAGLVARRQPDCPRLVSGAGHDAVALADVMDVAMLFVRCRDGLSHHPEEFASTADLATAVDVLADFLAECPV